MTFLIPNQMHPRRGRIVASLFTRVLHEVRVASSLSREKKRKKSNRKQGNKAAKRVLV